MNRNANTPHLFTALADGRTHADKRVRNSLGGWSNAFDRMTTTLFGPGPWAMTDHRQTSSTASEFTVRNRSTGEAHRVRCETFTGVL